MRVSVWGGRWWGRGTFQWEILPRYNKHNSVLLFGEPEGWVEGLQEFCLVLINRGHGVTHTIEGQLTLGIVHVDPDAGELVRCQRSFHVTVPGGETAAVPLEAPREVVSRDAAVALWTFSIDALVGEANMRSLSTHIHFKVVSSHVEALCGQHLPPVLKPLWHIRVRMLPRRGVGYLPVVVSQAQEFMDSVCIKADSGCIYQNQGRRHDFQYVSPKT